MKINKKFETILIIIVSIIICANLQSIFAYTDENGNVISEDEASKYSQEYIEYLKLSDEEKAKCNVIPRKEAISYDSFFKNQSKEDVELQNIPAKYDLRNSIDINVEDQKDSGWCWAFASIKSMETCYQKKNNMKKGDGEPDFSEVHLAYMRLKEMGGSTVISTSNGKTVAANCYTTGGAFYEFKYYVGLNLHQYCYKYSNYGCAGPVKQSSIANKPYVMEFINSNFKKMVPVVRVTDIVEYPNVTKEYNSSGKVTAVKSTNSTLNNNQIKEFRDSIKSNIMKNGGMYACTNISVPYWNNNKKSLYIFNNKIILNHAVTIIGWDDNYSRYNFSNPPIHDGAYIVLNSWGSNWGDNGVFYVSYDDNLIELNLSGVTGIKRFDEPPKLTISYAKENNSYESPVDVFINSDVELKNLPYGWKKVYDSSDTSNTKYCKKYTSNKNETLTFEPMYGNARSTSINVNVKSINKYVNSIKIDPTSYTFNDISPKQFSAVLNSDATNKNVKWTTSNSNVANVDMSGRVTFVGNGTCNITATAQDGSNQSSTAKIIADIKATDITLNKTSYKFTDTNAIELKTIIIPSYTANKSIKWTTSDEKVAKVYSNGKVIPIGPGVCNITVTTVDGTNLSKSCRITVDIKARKISLDRAKYTFTTTLPLVLNSIVSPAQASKAIKWTSSNLSVATVDDTGKVTPSGQGKCTIVATTTDGTNLSQSCNIVVDMAEKATSLSLSKSSYIFKVSTPITLDSIIIPDQSLKKLEWKSSNVDVAIVDEDGKVTPVGNGTCIITATTKDGTNLSKSCNITVNIKATSINLEKTNYVFSSTNQMSLASFVSPIQALQKVSWKSSNTNVATVDSTGKVTPVGHGICIITATTTDGTNLSKSCQVTVNIPVKSLYLNVSGYTFKTINPFKITAIINPYQALKRVAWSSSNTNIVTVDDTGKVTPVGNGSCVVTATTLDGSNLTRMCGISVDIKSTGINFDKTSYYFNNTLPIVIIPTIVPDITANKSIVWKSSNKSIAIVDSTGKVTPVGHGICTITATTTDGTNLSKSCQVTVNVPTTSFNLNKTSYTFDNYTPLVLNATVYPTQASKAFAWKSSNSNIAVVDTKGKITPVGKGTCIITATTMDGTNLSQSCNIISNVAYRKGDINKDGRVDATDVIYGLKKLVRGTLTQEENVIGDVNGNNTFDITDAIKIMNYIVGKIDSLA